MTVSILDYSEPITTPCPHDLIWAGRSAIDGDCPPWAAEVIERGAPVVVRRAPRGAQRVPVGIRGTTRDKRHAARLRYMPSFALRTPESLAADGQWIEHPRADEAPAIQALATAGCLLNAGGWRWGITGAVGYELASGVAATHADSDLDLLLRAPRPIERGAVRRLTRALGALSVRCDVQIETPAGGIALAEWAGEADRVLVKSDAGAFLTADPWTAAAASYPPPACV